MGKVTNFTIVPALLIYERNHKENKEAMLGCLAKELKDILLNIET
jgi:hypothetical protein